MVRQRLFCAFWEVLKEGGKIYILTSLYRLSGITVGLNLLERDGKSAAGCHVKLYHG